MPHIRPNKAGHAPFCCEPLESRQLLSAGPWSAQDQMIGLDLATQNFPSITGAGETVAIIDRGVDYNHPELGGGFGPGFKVVAGYDFQDNTGDVFPYDGDAHGTGTAGQIAAAPHYVNGQLYQGVAPGVNLVALKTNGTADIKAALDWIIKNRSQYNIVAINYLDKAGSNESAFVPELQSLTNAGVFIAGPSGNYGPSPAVASPGNLIHLVGSVDLNGQLNSFTPRGSALDLVAPGGGVTISWYENGQHDDVVSNGTSWAGPQVVGAAALIKQVNPNYTSAQVLSILRDSATTVWDGTSGMSYAELNVNAAITLAFQRSASAGTPAQAPQAVPAVQAAPPVSGAVGTPYLGTPFSTGQTIQVKYFNNGGSDVAYHDPTLFNTAGDAFRPGTVDTVWTRGAHTYALGWTQPGEWLNYTVNAKSTALYNLTARVSSLGVGGTFHFEVDGVDVTGPISIPDTGSWDRYVTVSHGGITLTAGEHVVKLVIDTTGPAGNVGNFASFKFTKAHVSHRAAHPSHAKAKPAVLRKLVGASTRAMAA